MVKKICIATSTRADWGILTPLARALRDRQDVTLQILATNMHLLDRYGHTIDEIRAQGFRVDAEVPMWDADDAPCAGQAICVQADADDSAHRTPVGQQASEADGDAARVRAMARCMAGTADALAVLRPDVLVILGDRYEMLAVASAAVVMRIPIAHIAGGEISEGAIDDSIRHAISKLSALHFTATEPYRQRVIQMGEDPTRVVNTGALGVWNIANQPLMPLAEVNASLGANLAAARYFVATYHSATLDGASVADRCRAFLEALDAFSGYDVVLTYPNNDTGSEVIVEMINAYAQARPQRIVLVKSLGMLRYLSAVKYAAAVIGNSSSGIVEVPSLGVPTVDIGMRQRGRISAPSVIHVGDSASDIIEGIRLAVSPDFQALARRCENPYYRQDTVRIMVEALLGSELSPIKKFHDL